MSFSNSGNRNTFIFCASYRSCVIIRCYLYKFGIVFPVTSLVRADLYLRRDEIRNLSGRNDKYVFTRGFVIVRWEIYLECCSICCRNIFCLTEEEFILFDFDFRIRLLFFRNNLFDIHNLIDASVWLYLYTLDGRIDVFVGLYCTVKFSIRLDALVILDVFYRVEVRISITFLPCPMNVRVFLCYSTTIMLRLPSLDVRTECGITEFGEIYVRKFRNPIGVRFEGFIRFIGILEISVRKILVSSTSEEDVSDVAALNLPLNLQKSTVKSVFKYVAYLICRESNLYHTDTIFICLQIPPYGIVFIK